MKIIDEKEDEISKDKGKARSLSLDASPWTGFALQSVPSKEGCLIKNYCIPLSFFFSLSLSLPNTVLKFRVRDETNPEKLVHLELRLADSICGYFPRCLHTCQPFELPGGHL